MPPFLQLPSSLLSSIQLRVHTCFEPAEVQVLTKQITAIAWYLPSCRHLWLPPPDLTLKLVVRCEHPVLGNFFHADLIGLRCQGSTAGARNEEAGLRTFLR